MRLGVTLTASALVAACQRLPADTRASDDGGARQTGEASTTHDAAPFVDAAASDEAKAEAEAAAPPALSLAVSPLTLTPAFSPSIYDYYVRCPAAANALTVTMTAPAGGTVALVQPTTTTPASSRTASISVAENEAIVVDAVVGSATNEYWVRCLPHDFPRLSMTPHPAAGTVVPGYYLVGDTFFTSGEHGYAMLLDTHGTPVWYDSTVTGAGAKDVDSLEPNTISYAPIAGYTFGTNEGQFEIHGLRPTGLSFVTSVGIPVDTHELRLLSNGDYLVFAAPVVTGVDLTGLGHYGPNEDILNCVIQEVSPTGQMVWQWSATDHLDPVDDCTWPQTVSATNLEGKEVTVVDPFHCNSIDVDSNGDLLVSGRHMDSIFLVSKTTGDILWKMGGSSFTKDGAPFIQVTGDSMGGFFRQHDARFQPDGAISLFDDETSRPGPARGLVLAYDVAAGTASIVWQYRGRASVGAMGSVTILPDGSRVIGWGTVSEGNPAFNEVTDGGVDLLDFTFPDGDSSYRALKLPLAAFDIGTLRAAVGPWSSSTTVLDAGSGQDSGSTSEIDGGSP